MLQIITYIILYIGVSMHHYTCCLSPVLYYTAMRLSQVQQVHSDLEQEPEAVREEFYGFLLAVIDSWTERQQLEEGSILSGES